MTYGPLRTDWKRVFKRIGRIETDLTLGSHIETVGEGTTSGGSGGSSGHIIRDEVTQLPMRKYLTLIGAGVSGSDNATDDSTDVIITTAGYTARGPYNSATTYNIDDVVNYGGSSWIALQNGFSAQTPVEGAYWTLLAGKGDTGTAGNTLLSGAAAPGSGVGVDGDFYVNTMTWDIYGPKTAGAWGSPTSMLAPDNEPSVTISSSGTAPTDKHLLLVNASAGAVVVTLPTAVGRAGKDYVVKKIDSSTNAVTIDGAGSETIDGLATIDTAVQGDAVGIESDGANWRIVTAPTYIP